MGERHDLHVDRGAAVPVAAQGPTDHAAGGDRGGGIPAVSVDTARGRPDRAAGAGGLAVEEAVRAHEGAPVYVREEVSLGPVGGLESRDHVCTTVSAGVERLAHELTQHGTPRLAGPELVEVIAALRARLTPLGTTKPPR